MPFKITYFFKLQMELEAGWSFSLFNNNTDIAPARAAALALLTPLDKLGGTQTIISNIRISDLTSFRSVSLLSTTITPDADLTQSNSSDYATTAVLLKVSGPGGYLARMWYRGVPDNIIRGAGRFNPTAAWLGYFSTMRGVLLSGSNQWSLRVLDKTVPKKIVQAVTQQGVCTVTGHGYATNSKVRISRGKGLTQINKVWRITSIDPNTFSLQGWVDPLVNTPYLGNATAQLQSPIFVPIVDVETVRASSHKTGRPFGLLGGRRRTRRT